MSVSSASAARGAQPSASTTTLRSLLDARRAAGQRFSLAEAVATIVPLSLDLQERHQRGERVYVHPSCVAPGADGLAKLAPALAVLPTSPRDRTCLAPELQATLAPGDAKATVFALGAILYEMLTGQTVGPGMARPREIEASLPADVETLLEKALVGDPTYRPDDIGALASALYHVAPGKSMHPPEVDPKNLNHTGEFDVNVRMSLLPPEEIATPGVQVALPAPAVPRLGLDPYGAPVSAPAASRPVSATVNERLAALKAHLESDPRPRYVVNKEKMDHGPFSAVELLVQIANHTFTGDHVLRDELSGQSQPIKDWEQFAPFAEQTALKREVVAEQKEVQRVARAEKTGMAAKSMIAIAVVGAIVAGGVLWFVKVRGARNDDVEVADDPNALDISLDGGVRGSGRRSGRHGGGGAAGGAAFSSGMSYEAAIGSNNTQINIGQAAGPDLTDTQLAGPMRNASFLNSCGAPDSMKVTVRVAIRMGQAVGVSVYTNPSNNGVAACIDRAVRGLHWPANSKMDSFTTTY